MAKEASAYDYDFFCVGGGSGGMRASRIAAKYGAKVGVCEEYRLGGTCVIRGCVPKKILWYGASFNHNFHECKNFGWTVESDRSNINWTKLQTAKDNEVTRLNGIYHTLLKNSDVDFHAGHGKFVDAHTIQIGSKKITAKYILICTGGSPWMPDIPGIEHAITSNEALDIKRLPNDMLIVGGGYIASEFAAIFQNVGVNVTQMYRGDRFLRGFDSDVRDAVLEGAKRQGINCLMETNVTKIEKLSNGRFKCTTTKGAPIETDIVFYATGRRPNLTNLGLEAAGIETKKRGATTYIPVDDYSQTNVDHIYAVGDVTDRIALTPVALEEGHAVADTLFGNNKRFLDHKNVASAVFTMPPVGSCGLSEEEAEKELGADGLDIYYTNFRPMKHTISGTGERTMMKLIVNKKTQVVIGIHIVGEHSENMIQLAAVAMKCGATKQQFDETVGVHPTAAEEIVTMRTARAPKKDTAGK